MIAHNMWAFCMENDKFEKSNLLTNFSKIVPISNYQNEENFTIEK